MITQNIFVQYNTINSKEDLMDWLNEGTTLLSNHENFEKEVEELASFKETHKRNYKSENGKRAYNNIFAHKIEFLIPYEIKNTEWNEFVKRYACAISSKYKTTKKKKGLLWICKYRTINKANYAELVMFTRKVYETPKTQIKKYTQDYYYKNGKRVKNGESIDGAVLKGKKGTPILDSKGNKLREILTVSQFEETGKTFRYSDWNTFVKKFKKKWLKVAQKMCDRENYKVISRLTIKETDSESWRRTKQKINESINEINKTLVKMQKAITDVYSELEQDFILLLDKVDSMTHKEHAEHKEIEVFIQTWWVRNVAEDWINA